MPMRHDSIVKGWPSHSKGIDKVQISMMNEYGGAGNKWKSSVSLQCSSVLMISL